MIKEPVIEAYMLNSKRTIAEMLYDTVNSYEETLKDAEWRMELALAQLESIEDRTCEDCRYFDEFKDDILHCNYFEQFFPTEIGKCDKWENR